MGVVPRVVVDQGCPVGEAGDLVPVVPPGHYDRLLLCVHSQPVVCFTIIVDYVTLATVF